MSQCPWKEYTADNGKIYYHNINTAESRWVIPPELEEIKAKIATEEAKTKDNVDSPSPAVTNTSEVNSPSLGWFNIKKLLF